MSTHNYKITTISIDQCLPLRRDVLWPLLQTQDCLEPGDEKATHYGYMIDDQLISCLSVFHHDGHRRQIRKFATRTDYQNKGIGTTLFKTVLQELKDDNVESVFLNARSTAIPFYIKFNFTAFDKEFTKNDVKFLPMEFFLKK